MNNRGGFRPGSGRKKNKNKRRLLILNASDDEWEKILNSLPRSSEKKTKEILHAIERGFFMS